ncbi:MAG TPA: helix-turn-helix domain-containing protein [Calditrichia bacterium]|nr:helix-turn-helix domain-containing protein [Calditrichota bacterium]HQU73012.1 helix-turn-helix domain-containing protein [Calditrichia bacterium]HQV30634.1 helix-turn-helix domain-containing protein [Calditrichia bacterium]
MNSTELSGNNLRFLLGIKLRQSRQKKGFSLRQLAHKTNLSISYLSEIEKGKKYPKLEKLLTLSRALGLSFDELVASHTDQQLDPLSAILTSPVIQEFPFRMYGVSPEEMLSLIANDLDKGSALIRTFLEIGQDYDMRVEHLLFAALRAYQQMHQNYFEDLEEAAKRFVMEQGWFTDTAPKLKQIRDFLLSKKFEIREEDLTRFPDLEGVRGFVVPGKKRKILLEKSLSDIQKAFVLLRIAGAEVLDLPQLPPTASWASVASFEQLLGNFKASYFAGAVLMPRDKFVARLRGFFRSLRWDGQQFLTLIDESGVTPEMFLYRMSELLPRFLKLPNLVFMRFYRRSETDRIHLSKFFNLTPFYVPVGLGSREHYCRRWGAIKLLRELDPRDSQPHTAVYQSHFVHRDISLFSIALAGNTPGRPGHQTAGAVSFVMDDAFRRQVSFWDDPQVRRESVHLTCERCPLPLAECAERVAPPVLYEAEQGQIRRENALREAIRHFSD